MKTKQCRHAKCQAEIVFLKTASGKTMPVDAESLTEEDCELLERHEEVIFRHGEHVSHFSTCGFGNAPYHQKEGAVLDIRPTLHRMRMPGPGDAPEPWAYGGWGQHMYIDVRYVYHQRRSRMPTERATRIFQNPQKTEGKERNET